MYNIMYETSHQVRCTIVDAWGWCTGTTQREGMGREEGEGVGDGRAEGSSAIGDGGQVAVSLMPDTDGTGSGSLVDSVLSTLLRK